MPGAGLSWCHPPVDAAFVVTLAAVVAAGIGARLVYLHTVLAGRGLGWDASWYLDQARNIASGNGYVLPTALFPGASGVATAMWPPLYPGLLAVFVWLGEAGQTALQTVGCVLGGVTIMLTGLLGRRIAGATAGLVAAVLAAGYPLLISSDASLMTETVYVPLTLAALLVTLALADRRASGPRRSRRLLPHVLLLGGLLGVVLLTRGNGVEFAVLLSGGLVAVAPRGAPCARLRLVVPALLVAVLAVLPWSYRNFKRLGTWAPSTSTSAGAIAGSNCAITYAGPEMGRWSSSCLPHRPGPPLNEMQWTSAAYRDGLTYARQHLRRLALVEPVRVLRAFGVWSPLDQARWEAFDTRDPTWQQVGAVCYLVLIPPALLGAVQLRGRRPLRLLAVPAAAVLVDVTLTYGGTRLRLMFDPVLLALAAAGIVRLVGPRPPTRGGRAGVPVHPGGGSGGAWAALPQKGAAAGRLVHACRGHSHAVGYVFRRCTCWECCGDLPHALRSRACSLICLRSLHPSFGNVGGRAASRTPAAACQQPGTLA